MTLAATACGIATPFAIAATVDKKYPGGVAIPALKRFGKPSVIASVAGGAILTAASLVGTDYIPELRPYESQMLAFGFPLLITGLAKAFTAPNVTPMYIGAGPAPMRARPQNPNNWSPVAPSGALRVDTIEAGVW